MSWAAIAAAVLKGLAALAEWFQSRQQIDAGKAEQKAADQDAAQKEERQAHDVAITVGGGSDAAIDELSNEWTRPRAKP